MRNQRKKLSIMGFVLGAVVAMGLSSGIASAAEEVPVQSGSQPCPPPNEFSWITARTMGGAQKISPPGAGAQWEYGLPDNEWTQNSYPGARGGGNWDVFGLKRVDKPFTNTWCVPFT